MTAIEITHFTDPACPFGFSAEPIRQRLRWHYGAGLEWRTVLIQLTAGDRHEANRLAGGAPTLQRQYGMPIDPAPRARPASSEPACRAVVAARLFAPGSEEHLLRRLRVLGMAGGLLDDPQLIGLAAIEAGLQPDAMAVWLADPGVTQALEADMTAARTPSVAALALEHKLGGTTAARRYSAPSYEMACGQASWSLPGFNPIDAYEAAVANLAPAIERRPTPARAREVLEWAQEPLATAEIALIMQSDAAAVRSELARTAHCLPAGADAYWSLEPFPSHGSSAAVDALIDVVHASRAI
jgi:predicted DsbA family dithiol-disulfide isomerase